MMIRDRLIRAAIDGDFGAVDALIREGNTVMEDVLRAMNGAAVSTSHTLGFVVTSIATPADAAVAGDFIVGDVSLEAFVAAAKVLSRVGDPAGSLRRFMESDDEPATRRGIAARAMARTGVESHKRLLHSVAAAAESSEELVLLVDCIEALITLGDHSMDRKAAGLLQSRKLEPKLRAAAILPYLFYDDLVATLRTALANRNAEIRRVAIDALYLLGNRTAAEELRTAVRDRDAHTRANAAARLSWITGSEGAVGIVEVSSLASDVCYRDGGPINLEGLAGRATDVSMRTAVVEELRIITGARFDYNPERPDHDSDVVERIRSWLSKNGDRYLKGGCYKFGHRQELRSLK